MFQKLVTYYFNSKETQPHNFFTLNIKATLANHECILSSLAKFPLALTDIDFTQLEITTLWNKNISLLMYVITMIQNSLNQLAKGDSVIEEWSEDVLYRASASNNAKHIQMV